MVVLTSARVFEVVICWFAGSGGARKPPTGLEEVALREKTGIGRDDESFHSI